MNEQLRLIYKEVLKYKYDIKVYKKDYEKQCYILILYKLHHDGSYSSRFTYLDF